MVMRAPIRVVGSNVAQPTGLADPARTGAGIARGAMLIAGLTIVSRILGLVRTLVFSQTIGATCLGTAYVTANQVPNLIYELVLGGALTSAMVPVLARSAERAATRPGREGAGRPDHLGAANLVRRHPGAAVPGHRGGRRAGRLAAQPGQRQRALPPRRHGQHHLQHARGVRPPGPAVRALGRAVRPAPGLPPVRRPGHRPGHLQPGPDRGLSLLRAAGQGPAAGHAAAAGRAGPVGGDHAGGRGPGRGGRGADVAAAPAVAAHPAVPARRGAPGQRPGPGRRGRAHRRRRGLPGDHRPGQRARTDGRPGHLQLRLAGLQHRGRGTGPVDRDQRVSRAVGPRRAGIRPDLRRLDPRHPAHVLARCGADRGGRGPGRARPGQAAGPGTATDRGLCPVRPGDRGHRGDRQPGPRHAGHRPAQGRRRRGGRKLGRW